MTCATEPLHGAPFDPEITHIYPDATLRIAVDSTLPPRNWYVLRTKPRQESRAQLNLKAWGLQTLLPQLPAKRRRPSDGIRALFPSYMFCRFPENMFDKVKYTYGVAHVVSFGGAPAVVDQAIIDELAARLDPDGYVLPLHPQSLGLRLNGTFKPGEKVLIESGPFKNLIGVFEKDLPGSDRVRILLDAVKFQSRVECDRGDVRPLHGASGEPLHGAGAK
jgi:transcriptional antiterminator RfaH